MLSLVTDPPRLLRPGQITATQIEQVIGPIERGALASPINEPLPSPGLLNRHYAPATVTESVESKVIDRVKELLTGGLRVGLLTHEHLGIDASRFVVRELPNDPAVYAARLYATLFEMDQLNLDRIIVQMPPATEEWFAIRDRLRRASAQD